MALILEDCLPFVDRRLDIDLALRACDRHVQSGGEIMRRYWLERESLTEISQAVNMSPGRCRRSYEKARVWIRENYGELEEYLALNRYQSMRRTSFGPNAS